MLAAGILAFYLSVYAVRGYDQPLGYDTARYLWRTNCVAAAGLDGLRACATRAAAIPSRIAYPLVSLLATTAVPMSRHAFAAILPPVAAVIIALTGAALVSWSLGLDRARFAVLAVILGVSPVVVALANPEGYADTMLALAVGLAAMLAVAIVADRGRGYVVGAVLLGTAALIHASTGLVLAAVVVGVGLAYAPAAWAAVRNGRPARSTVSARMGGVAGLSVAAWGLGLVAGVGASPDRYRAPIANLEEKLRSHLPRLGLPVALPAALAGMAVLWWGRSRQEGTDRGSSRRTFLVAVFGVWLGIVLVAAIAWMAGWKLPLHRFFLLGLPIPLLGAVALLWAGDEIGKSRARLGVAVVGAGCVAVIAAGFVLWSRNAPPVLRSPRLAVAASAADYLSRLVPAETRVTVVTDREGVNPDVLRQTFRVPLPPDRIRRVAFRPTVDGSQVVLILDGYAAEYPDAASSMPERVVAPGVVAVEGPLPAAPLASVPAPKLQPSAPELLILGLAVFAILVVMGAGWSMISVGRFAGPLETLAVAPAFGLVVLVTDGLILDRAGLALRGTPAVLALVVSGLVSMGLAVRQLGRPDAAIGETVDGEDRA